MNWLLDTSMGAPGFNGRWPIWLTVLFHLSNAIGAIELIAVPCLFQAIWNNQRDTIRSRSFLKVMAFFPALAATKLVRVGELWGHPYHLTVMVDVLAAALTTYATFHLASLLRHVLLLPSRAKLNQLNVQLTDDNLVLEGKREDAADVQSELGRRVLALEISAQSQGWQEDTLRSLAEIRRLMAQATGKEAHIA